MSKANIFILMKTSSSRRMFAGKLLSTVVAKFQMEDISLVEERLERSDDGTDTDFASDHDSQTLIFTKVKFFQ